MSGGEAGPPRSVAGALAAALDRLGAASPVQRSIATAMPLAGAQRLLHCAAICDAQGQPAVEPLRTLHHFACTGGTLISRCIAAMPNVQLLSEIDPLSPGPSTGPKPRFAPTDMIAQLRQSTRGGDPALILEMFCADLQMIHADASARGQRLVLRDHAHSHYCRGAAVPERPNLREIVAPVAPTRSLVSVRHPLDSYTSLEQNEWLHFSPPTIDEYCRRQLKFLDAYEGLPIVKYEDFVDAPSAVMPRICDWLALPYQPLFEELYGAFKITGDSGRASRTITRHPRRAEAHAHQREALDSSHYRALCDRLGYEVGTDLAQD